MINLQFEAYNFTIKEENNKRYIFDIVRKKYIQLTPEEWVRQHIIWYFIYQLNYPKALLSVEKQIKVNGLVKRYDIVVYDANVQPWMIVECKEFGKTLQDDALHQLLSYQQIIQCPYGVISNGKQTFCCELNLPHFSWLSQMPLLNN